MKRKVSAHINITREEDLTVNLSAIVTQDGGRFYFNSIEQDNSVELTAAEYRDAEDAIFDAARLHWDSFPIV